MSLTRWQVIDYLESLPAEELGALADEVLARLGMRLPRVVAVPPPPFRTSGRPIDIEPMSGPEEMDVVLRAPGPDRLAVVRIVRRMPGQEIGLAEAMRLVDSAPVRLCVQVRTSDALELVKRLREAGADADSV